MKHNYKRLLAAALTLVMVLAFLPIVALADGPFDDLAAAEGVTIVSRHSTGGALDNPTVATTFTVTSSTIITGIHTYHWASGDTDDYQSATFALTHSDGTTYGPWPVTATVGGIKTNTNWFAFPSEIIKPGTYTLLNSKNATWSHNTETGSKGMCDIKGVAVGDISSGTVNITVTGAVTAEATFGGIATTGTLKLDKGPLTITGTGANGIVVTGKAEAPNAVVPLLLDGVVSTAAAPVVLSTGAKVDLTLKGTNVLTAGISSNAALSVPSGCTLTIGGEGSLSATSSGEGAGIGGNSGQENGTIIINSGTIIAHGSPSGAGIGGGKSGSGGIITINGGTITARSGQNGAGIGGGSGGSGGTITINGGIITASSNGAGGTNNLGIGAGIGGGNGGASGTITINGGTVTAYSSSIAAQTGAGNGIGPGMGSGGAASSITISGGNILAKTKVSDSALCIDSPKDADTTSLYPIVITLGSCTEVVSVTAGSIGGVACSTSASPTAGYGIEGIKTFSDGKLILWLPAQADTAVSITAGGAVYTGTITVSSTENNTATLTTAAVPAIIGLSANPATLGSAGGNATVTVSGSNLPANLEVKAFDGATATAISGTTTGSGNTGTVTLTFPANSGNTDKVYTIKAASPTGGASWDGETCTVTVQKKVVAPPYSGGGNAPAPATAITTVNQPENGTVAISPAKPVKGDAVAVNITPDEGFAIDSITVKDKKGKSISVTRNDDGSYRFIHPGDEVIIEAELVPLADFEQEGWQNPFNDVSDNAWYFDAVRYVAENGVMNGTGATTFAPGISPSRAMLVQILYNLEGRPNAGSSVFSDVDDNAWYADAVAWAAANDIVGGMGNGLFAPDGDITREQMALMLYNYCKYKGITLPDITDAAITDAGAVSDWALEAVQAMYRAGILSGKGGGVFDPKGTATRAEVAQMIMNFMEAIEK